MQDYKQRVMEELIECTDTRVQHNDMRQQIISAETRQMKEDTQLFLDIIKRVASEPTQGDTESTRAEEEVVPTDITPVCVQPLDELMLRVPKLYAIVYKAKGFFIEDSNTGNGPIIFISDDLATAITQIKDIVRIYTNKQIPGTTVDGPVFEMLTKFLDVDVEDTFVATFESDNCSVSLRVGELFFEHPYARIWNGKPFSNLKFHNGQLITDGNTN